MTMKRRGKGDRKRRDDSIISIMTDVGVLKCPRAKGGEGGKVLLEDQRIDCLDAEIRKS